MKKIELLKKLFPGFLLLIVVVLGYKFIAWNYWKLERAKKLYKDIQAAPSAVNLVLTKKNNKLYQQGFEFNSNGKYYIVNRFDITPFIGEKLSVNFYINHKKIEPVAVYPSETYNLVFFSDYIFAFTNPKCNVEAFVDLRNSLPRIIKKITPERGENNKYLKKVKILE